MKSSMTLYAHWDEEPVITTKDIHIFEDLYTEQEWKKVRLEQVKAMDKEDGDISDRLTVLNDTTNLHKQGQYSITYQVKDNAGNTVSKEGRVLFWISARRKTVCENISAQFPAAICRHFMRTASGEQQINLND